RRQARLASGGVARRGVDEGDVASKRVVNREDPSNWIRHVRLTGRPARVAHEFSANRRMSQSRGSPCHLLGRRADMNPAKQIETNRQPLVVKRGEGETIKALGSEITFLCRQPGEWSLTRVSLPRDVGAPPHAHDFDESFYVVSGSLWLSVADQEIVLG